MKIKQTTYQTTKSARCFKNGCIHQTLCFMQTNLIQSITFVKLKSTSRTNEDNKPWMHPTFILEKKIDFDT